MKAPVLESERLIYKPVSMQHLSEEYVEWMNDPEVTRYMESGGNYTIEKLEEFLKQVEKKEIMFWGIHLKENGLHLGNIKIDPIQLKHGLGEYGIMMGRKSEWGKGYAAEASRRIIDFCFEELNLRKITLGVVMDNEGAVRLYKKLGFTLEGVYKRHALYGSKYCDVARMAIFNGDFNDDT
jgi:RimJ/RimL family protein N-acetyltransferase